MPATATYSSPPGLVPGALSFRVRLAFLPFLLMIPLTHVFSQSSQTISRQELSSPFILNEDVDTCARQWWLGSGFVLADAGAMALYFTTYYAENSDKRSSWHVFGDWYNTDMNVDKLGHLYATQIYSNSLYHAFRWARVTETTAMIWSGSLAFLIQLEMEITDGFYRNWGFSWWDIGANAVGAAYPHLQRLSPVAHAVTLKASYHPSRILVNRWSTNPIADYDGFTYWLCFNPHGILPKSWQEWWPSWLAVAVGYGAENTMLGKGIYHSDQDNHGLGTQEWYLGLDLDIRQWKSDIPFLQLILETLHYIRLPLPAIRIRPGVVWYGLYF